MPTPDDRWFEAVARVDARDADLVADMLTDAGATGVSIEPAIHVQDNADFAYEELMDEPWTVRATFVEPFDEAEQAAVRATIEGLQGQMSPRMVAQRRGRKVADILPKAAEAQAPAEAAEA